MIRADFSPSCIYIPTIADLEHIDHDLIVLDATDEPPITYPILPELSEH